MAITYQSLQLLSLNLLPDKCLSLIFDHLPSWDLLFTIGQVCTRWRRLCQSVGMNRCSLTLLINRPKGINMFDIPFTSDENLELDLDLHQKQQKYFTSTTTNHLTVLSLDSLNNHLVNRLTSLFPNVHSLTLRHNSRTGTAHCGPNDLEPLLLLLYHYWPQLTSLLIGIEFEHYHLAPLPVELVRQLYLVINSMISLRWLSLQVNGWLRAYCHQPTDYETRAFLPIISQLDHFELYCADAPDIIIEQIARFGAAIIRPLTLGFGNPRLHEELFHFTQLSPKICTRFTNFPLHHNYFPLDSVRLPDIVTKFPSLTTLWLSFKNDNNVDSTLITKLFTPLSTLLHLIYLKLDIHFQTNSTSSPSLSSSNTKILTTKTSLCSPMTFCSSVLVLDLSAWNSVQRLLLSKFDLDIMFPSVQVINLRTINVQICQQQHTRPYDNDNYNDNNEDEELFTIDQLVKCLKKNNNNNVNSIDIWPDNKNGKNHQKIYCDGKKLIFD